MLFTYTDMNKNQAQCDIERIGRLVIMTELANNTGASVTNAVEYIIEQYCKQNDLNYTDLIIVEQYDDRSYDFPSETNRSIVTFTPNQNGKLAPTWQHISSEKFGEMVKQAQTEVW